MKDKLDIIQQQLNDLMNQLENLRMRQGDFNNTLQNFDFLIKELQSLHLQLPNSRLKTTAQYLLSSLQNLNTDLVDAHSDLKSLNLETHINFYLDTILTQAKLLELQQGIIHFNLSIINHFYLEFKNSVSEKYKYVADIFEKIDSELDEIADTYMHKNIAVTYENGIEKKVMADFDWFRAKCAEVITKHLDNDEVKQAFQKDEYPLLHAVLGKLINFLNALHLNELAENLMDWHVHKSQQIDTEKTAYKNFVTFFNPGNDNKSEQTSEHTDESDLNPKNTNN